MEDWKGCELEKCLYGKEYGDCDMCVHLITKADIDPNEKWLDSLGMNGLAN